MAIGTRWAGQSPCVLVPAGLQLFQPPHHIRPQVKANHPPPGIQQRLLIAQGLGHLEHAKGHRRIWRSGFVRDRSVIWGIGGKLDKEAVSGVALVELSGRVEETRPVANRMSHPAQADNHRRGCPKDLRPLDDLEGLEFGLSSGP